jgi:ectoine hydroxylase-related dioxygenase (phytanoyl-CoA dioxygenase family)
VNYSIAKDGFSMVEGLLPEAWVYELVGFVEQNLSVDGRRGGVRNLLDMSRMRELAESSPVRGQAEAVLGKHARVVRGILFDKTESANWKVPWHQDVTIAVNRKVEADGFGPWSQKEGVLHVQAPATVLEKMVSIRLHLDDCPEENGALRVIVGSHLKGKLPEREIQSLAERSHLVTCAMRRGCALLMRPLLLHASSASSVPGHRRVIHLDYAAVSLPNGLEWAMN